MILNIIKHNNYRFLYILSNPAHILTYLSAHSNYMHSKLVYLVRINQDEELIVAGIQLKNIDLDIRRKQNLGSWDDSFLMRLIAGWRHLDA